MVIKKLFTISLLAGIVSLLPAAAYAASPSLLITEVQTHSATSSDEEFVELYNPLDQAVNVEGWKVDYMSASGATTTTITTLTGDIPAKSFVLFAKTNYAPVAVSSIAGFFDKDLSNSAGHIVIKNGETIIDKLGWGNAASPEAEGIVAAAAGTSFQRKVVENTYADSDNNKNDFIAQTATPLEHTKVVTPSDFEEPEITLCDGLEINEILPNPAGSDSQNNEFIELYNSSDTAAMLKNCKLSTDKKSNITLPDIEIKPGAYYSLALSNLLLNDSGKVTLVTASTEQEVTYPTLEDDQSWALANGIWQATATPTPGAENTITNQPGRGGVEEEATACPEGKYRNPETNRCKNIEEATVTVCDPGEERNPATNRCRKITLASATLAACDPGSERNPATNRCRKVATAEDTLKPCDEGEERNPDTNRCRKVAGASTIASTHTPQSSQPSSNPWMQWWPVAIAGMGILAYGLYEYRQDIRNGKRKLIAKFKSSPKE